MLLCKPPWIYERERDHLWLCQIWTWILLLFLYHYLDHLFHSTFHLFFIPWLVFYSCWRWLSFKKNFLHYCTYTKDNIFRTAMVIWNSRRAESYRFRSKDPLSSFYIPRVAFSSCFLCNSSLCYMIRVFCFLNKNKFVILHRVLQFKSGGVPLGEHKPSIALWIPATICHILYLKYL